MIINSDHLSLPHPGLLPLTDLLQHLLDLEAASSHPLMNRILTKIWFGWFQVFLKFLNPFVWCYSWYEMRYDILEYLLELEAASTHLLRFSLMSRKSHILTFANVLKNTLRLSQMSHSFTATGFSHLSMNRRIE